jgi:hypothetical protein
MKKIILIGLFAAMATGAYAQGTVFFTDRSTGTLVFSIYAPQVGSPNVSVQGNSSTTEGANGTADFPAGSTVYDATSYLGGASGAGVGLTGPFTPGSAIYTQGNEFTVALYAAGSTSLLPASALSLVPQYEGTMRQAFNAGTGTFVANAISGSDPGIPNTPSYSATVAVAAWYNDNGLITSLAQAEADNVPYGETTPVLLAGLGDATSSPPVTPPNLIGLQSFSLINPSVTPEPGTIALGLVGVCGFLARRRKK